MDIQYLLLLQHFRESTHDVLSPFLIASSDFIVGIWPVWIMAFIFLCVDKRQGYFMMASLWGSNVINQFIKNTCCVYRPWIRDAAVLPYGDSINTATGYSLPSGHTEYATTFFGSIAIWLRKYVWVTVLAVLAILIIGFSRNYLGVHAPQDVCVAIIECILVLWGVYALFTWIERHPDRDWLVLIIGLAVLLVYILYATLKPYPMDYVNGKLLVDPARMIKDCYSAGGAALAVLTGWFIESRWIQMKMDRKWYQYIWRFVVAAALIWVFRVLLTPICVNWVGPNWGVFISYALMVWSMTIITPAISKLTRC